MSDQPKFNDRESWKKIGNALMFIVGAGCFFFWLANGPMLPDPNKVLQGHTWVTVQSNIHPEHVTGFAGWLLHSGMLMIGIVCIALAFRNQVRWRKQAEFVEREEQMVRTQARLSPINQLSGRRDKKKPQPEIEVEVNGQKIKLKPMTCDIGTLILPGDPRFTDLSFDKVIGQSEAKVEIEEFLHFLQNPEAYASMEAKVPRGVLMHGAHGTGKTMLARTLAARCKLPVIEIAGS